MVRCKIYTIKIIIFYNNEEIARHNKVYGIGIWKVDITHYVKTLFRKSRALESSTAFKQIDDILKNICIQYFKNNDKEFVRSIELVGIYSLVAIDNTIKNLIEVFITNISIDKIEFICSRKQYILRIITMK